MRAEKHIEKYNDLDGRKISKKNLRVLIADIQKDIDDKKIDSHVPFGVECFSIVKKLTAVIEKNKGVDLFKIHLNPISLKRYTPPPAKKLGDNETRKPAKPAPDPAKEKRQDIPTKRKQELDKKSRAGVTFKDLKGVKEIEEKPAPEAPQPNPIKTDKKRGVSGLPAAKLNGVLDASALAGMVFKVLELTGRYKTDFHKLYNDTLILIWGLPGSGKTVYLLEFAQYLASALGLKVLYVANEEWGRSTLSEKINSFKIGHNNLKLAKDLNSLKASGYKLQDFDAVFMDSVQSLGFTLDTFKKFVEENPGRIYIPIVQSTKDGDFRGGKDWEHEVDVAGEIVNRKLILRKNRLDPDFEKKASKLRIENLVHEKKEANRIKDMVNKGTTKPVPEKESKTVNV